MRMVPCEHLYNNCSHSSPHCISVKSPSPVDRGQKIVSIKNDPSTNRSPPAPEEKAMAENESPPLGKFLASSGPSFSFFLSSMR